MLRSPTWRLIRAYLLAHWPLALLLAALLGLLIALDLVQPQLVRAFLDTAQGGGATSQLLALAALFLGAAIAAQVVGLAEQIAAGNLGWLATNALRADLTRHCLELGAAFHHTRTPGELIERLDGDVDVLANFFSRFVLQVIGNGLLLIGILVLLFRADWRAGLLMLAFSLLAVAFLTTFRSAGARFHTKSRQASAELFGFLEERLAGLADIRTAGASGYVLAGLGRLLEVSIQRGRAAFVVGSIFGGAAGLVFTAASAAMLAYAAYRFHAGAMSLGTVYLLFRYATMVRDPLGEVAHQMRDYQRAAASLARVHELLALPRAVPDGPGAPLPAGPLAVEFGGVSFTYPAARIDQLPPPPALRAASFRLTPGKVLGVLGRTGSGKSTLARLLCRLYDPTVGEILLGGVPLPALRLADLRRRVGLVTQEVQLFAGSVRDNLALFDPAMLDERIVAALDALGLDGWLASLPAGLDTLLASGGGGLSAGEAQLLAFARVFLRDPDVVVLDEASSRLDPATEARIERAVDALLAGRTAIVIAHRLGTLARADALLLLEDGQIVEYGERAALTADPTSRFAALLRGAAQEVLA